MPKLILLDRYTLNFYLPPGTSRRVARQAARRLDTVRLRRRLRQTVRTLLQQYPELVPIRVRVTG